MTKKKKTKTYEAISKCYREILEGTVLAIDPSTGSRSSRPGFAWYEAGVLKESGEIIVDLSANRSKRLYEIARTVREEFPVPDVLVVEYIPPVTYRGSATRMNGTSLMALQKAIGAIIGAHPFEHLIEIPAVSWSRYKPDNYVKTDEWDSIVIGLCAVEIAKTVLKDKEGKQ